MKDSRSFIRKYKNALIALLLLGSSMFVIMQVILPQIDQIQNKSQEIEKERKRVETLKTTIDVLLSISEEELDKYFKLTQLGLPQVKDILSIYNEIASAAQRNEVELGDLTINLGDIYSKKKKESIDTNVLGSNTVLFDVNVEGSVENLRSFSQALYRSTPVVEIKTVSLREDRGVLNVNFFYNPFTVTTADTDTPATNFTKAELDLLSELETWSENSKFETEDAFSTTITPSPGITVTPTIRPTISPESPL